MAVTNGRFGASLRCEQVLFLVQMTRASCVFLELHISWVFVHMSWLICLNSLLVHACASKDVVDSGGILPDMCIVLPVWIGGLGKVFVVFFYITVGAVFVTVPLCDCLACNYYCRPLFSQGQQWWRSCWLFQLCHYQSRRAEQARCMESPACYATGSRYQQACSYPWAAGKVMLAVGPCHAPADVILLKHNSYSTCVLFAYKLFAVETILSLCNFCVALLICVHRSSLKWYCSILYFLDWLVKRCV